MDKHISHPRIEERKKEGHHATHHEQVGFNGKLAVFITKYVGTMWCAYFFAILAGISLPAAIQSGNIITIDFWICQNFLQLVLLSIIMVGQKVSAQASDKQAEQTYKDAEAILKIQDEVHELIKINNRQTSQIHRLVKEEHEEEV